MPIVDPGIMVALEGYEPYELGMQVSMPRCKRVTSFYVEGRDLLLLAAACHCQPQSQCISLSLLNAQPLSSGRRRHHRRAMRRKQRMTAGLPSILCAARPDASS